MQLFAMQETQLMKAGILATNEQGTKKQQQVGGRPRSIRLQNNMNSDTTNNSGINITNNNPNSGSTANSNPSNNHSTSSNTNTQPPPLRCPRCDSSNTKFCYYNNYSLLQPRYFCKSCRRYWTKGGALRNVPVGGGCRKNKRITTRQRVGGTSDLMSSSSSSSFLSHPHLGDHRPALFSSFGDHGLNTPRPAPSFSLLNHPHDLAPPPHLLYFNLPSNDHLTRDNSLLNQPFFPPPPMPSAEPHELSSPSAGPFSRQLASYLPSSVASQYLSSMGSLPLQNCQGFRNDYLSSHAASVGVTDHQQLVHPSSFNNSIHLTSTPAGSAMPAIQVGMAPTAGHRDSSNVGFKAFSLPFDDLSTGEHDDQHWAMNKMIPHEQKLLTDQKLHHVGSSAMENHDIMQEGPIRLYTHLRSQILQSPKAEDGWPPQHHEQVTSSGGFDAVRNQPAGSNYWTSGGWNDVSGYNPGSDHPFV